MTVVMLMRGQCRMAGGAPRRLVVLRATALVISLSLTCWPVLKLESHNRTRGEEELGFVWSWPAMGWVRLSRLESVKPMLPLPSGMCQGPEA